MDDAFQTKVKRTNLMIEINKRNSKDQWSLGRIY